MCQVESKIRALKMEKLNASVAMNSSVLAEAGQVPEAEAKKDQEGESADAGQAEKPDMEKQKAELLAEREQDKHAKGLQQLAKNIMQLDKKLQLKKSYDQSMNKLRSGAHLGKDRYYRHWHLNNLGDI